MDVLMSGLLWMHIVAGTAALVAGLLAMASRKGGRLHRRSGSVFYISMAVVAASALVLAANGGSRFLAHIAVFSVYQLYAGKRSLVDKSLKPRPADWLFLAIFVVNALMMVATMNVILVVFGSIALMLGLSEAGTFRGASRGLLPKRAWLRRHIGMMVGTYIGTVTAFVVVNVNFVQPSWLPWVLPTAIFVPLIVYWQRKYASGKPKELGGVPA